MSILKVLCEGCLLTRLWQSRKPFRIQELFFIISTHIIEVGETLRERCDNLQFAYLPTVMEGTVPRYTYKMERGSLRTVMA